MKFPSGLRFGLQTSGEMKEKDKKGEERGEKRERKKKLEDLGLMTFSFRSRTNCGSGSRDPGVKLHLSCISHLHMPLGALQGPSQKLIGLQQTPCFHPSKLTAEREGILEVVERPPELTLSSLCMNSGDQRAGNRDYK